MKNFIIALLMVSSLQSFSQGKIDEIKSLFAQRSQVDKLNECIRIGEEELSREINREVAVYVARAYYFKGETEADKNAKLEIYLKGVSAGEKALSTVPSYNEAISKTKKEEEAIKSVAKEDIEAMYWIAANLARYAKFAPFGKKLSVKGRVRYLWDHVLAVDPDFNYGGVYRFFGGYFSLVPSITGEQDPTKSKEMFDKGVASAPHYLETKVLYAEAYCTHAKIKNRELFNKLLEEVLAEDISKYPEIFPENDSAQKKAKDLLAQANELFE